MTEREYTGRVVAVNPRRGLAAVLVEGYGYTVLEVLGPFNLQEGDSITGALRRHATQRVSSARSGGMRVAVQAFDAGEENARTLLR